MASDAKVEYRTVNLKYLTGKEIQGKLADVKGPLYMHLMIKLNSG